MVDSLLSFGTSIGTAQQEFSLNEKKSVQINLKDVKVKAEIAFTWF